ncbi:MAG: helix-turn-helix domain-containing protein [Sumerlaeia bacterium]
MAKKRTTSSAAAPLRRTPDEHFSQLDLSDLPVLVPVAVAAQRLGTSRHAIYQLLSEGEISAVRISPRTTRIFRDSLLDYLRRQLV